MYRKHLMTVLAAFVCLVVAASPLLSETKAQRDARMKWWREARFGLFIHWGLYAIPGGEWKGRTNHAEWIRHTARIPLSQYEQFISQFNPVKFDADQWVQLAKEAGMKYIVITSKHHDGFCLFDSQETDFDVGSTPFKRDILKELSEACKRHGIRLCFYYSIMDWHHPDYLPRRSWEARDRPAAGADLGRYVAYMKRQLKELIERYDPGVLWFDGEWESTWTHQLGKDLYQYVRSLKPDIIINNRVDKGRRGMQGMTKEGEYCGDFGTPEQEIPDQGLPGVDWETCMTMNNHWGWNKHDRNWKSTQDLIRKLIDIASKGGNFLLNVGPKPDGTFPQEAVERLKGIGAWLRKYGEAIYATGASPLPHPSWGRITKKTLPCGTTRLYLHVFTWPRKGRLILSGIVTDPAAATLLGAQSSLSFHRHEHVIVLENLPRKASDSVAAVIALDFSTPPEVIPLNCYENESPQQRNARMKWWREARFGLFIHWGVYAVPAGTYKGRRIPGIGEWIMNRAKIPVSEYRAYARKFNPVKYDPDFWVRLAKEAGMKYIVITSKHHDGFALFDSKVTEWDVVDATPYGKDLLKPLAQACRRHGLKLGFYYSQAQDWNHPGGAAAGGHWDKAQDGDMDDYILKIALPQVKEILTNYGPVAILWWDTPVNMNRERATMLLPLIRLQKGIITNNRLGGGYPGDFGTPEQHIPATGIPGRDWETCMTMNRTWGYKSYDQNWKSTKTLVRNLIDIASKGGNYLLNVGPTALGEIPQASVERLKGIGAWMRVNGEAIYATTASPFKHLPWGRCTKKVRAGGATLYLHVFDWPAGRKLLLPGLRSRVRSVKLLATGKPLTFETEKEGVVVHVPAEPLSDIATVIVLEIEGTLRVEEPPLRQSARGEVLLPARRAEIHDVGGGNTPQVETKYGKPNIGFWIDARDWISWRFEITRGGTFTVSMDLAAEQPSRFTLSVGSTRLQVQAPSTGNWGAFRTVRAGTLALAKPGTYTLTVRPDRRRWKPVNIRAVRLLPQK